MSTNRHKITRFKAFAIHIGISSAIFLCLLVLLLGYWYKTPFFDLEDGPRAIQIILFVDLVLGPLLTLVIFKPGKPGLKFDLSLIAIFQLSALIYGIWMVQLARPVAVIHAYDSLYIVSKNTIINSDIPEPVANKIIGLEPTYLYVNLPKEQESFNAIIASSFREKRPIQLLYKYYEPLKLTDVEKLSAIAIDIRKYTAKNEEWSAKLDAFLKRHKRSLDNTLLFAPVRARRGPYFLVIDTAKGEIIDYLEVPYIPGMGIEARVVPHDKLLSNLP